MTRRLLIVLMNTDPRNAEELGAPFYYAAVAAAIRIKPDDPKTVYDWIKEAHDQGARFWACPANLDLFDKSEADLIPECAGLMGAAAMIQDIMDGECKVLTF